MTRSTLIIVMALAGLTALPAQAPAETAGSVTLRQGWEFLPDRSDQGLAAGLQSGTNGTGWRHVRVPHVLTGTAQKDVFKRDIGWYRLRFVPPPIADGRSWAIRFGQARRFARVWLNGRAIGRHDDGYVPFTLGLPGLRPGRTNTLVVRVDSFRPPKWREGWWNWGGLTREVSLIPRGDVTAEGIGVVPRLRCAATDCRGGFLVDGWVRNRTAKTTSPTVQVTLRAPDGDTIERRVDVDELGAGERRRVRFRVEVADPKLWSPDDPALYSAAVRVRDGERIQHTERLRVGLRSVEVRRGWLHLNGRRIQLRGASIQEDVQGRGPALREADMDRIVTDLKSLGANVTRAHYLLNEGLLERFDRAGILVWNQAPIYHRDRLLKTPAERAAALATVRDTVLEARNHPSVLTHSVANELSPTPDVVAGTRIFLERSAPLTRDLDPSVPVSLDLLTFPNYPRQETYELFDLLGLNTYFGWYKGKPGHSTADFADLEPFVRQTHQRYPGKALVITEFGAEADADGLTAGSFDFQSRYFQRHVDLTKKLDFLGGLIYWTLREFAVKPNWYGGGPPRGVARDAIHRKALITYGGDIKPAFRTAQRIYRQTPLFVGDLPRAGATPREAGFSIPGAIGALFAIALLLAAIRWLVRHGREIVTGAPPPRPILTEIEQAREKRRTDRDRRREHAA